MKVSMIASYDNCVDALYKPVILQDVLFCWHFSTAAVPKFTLQNIQSEKFRIVEIK